MVTSGIGEAVAKLFLREGANVMLIGRSVEKLRETRSRLGADARGAYAAADAAEEAATRRQCPRPSQTSATSISFIRMHSLEGVRMADFEEVLLSNVLGVWLAMNCTGRTFSPASASALR